MRGWIRAIRNALGMTAEQLGKRVGVKQPAIAALEQSEAKGTIELATLRRVAEALDCTLVYALVPNRPLEASVRARARAFLHARRPSIEHTMLLENQGVKGKNKGKNLDARVDEIVRETSPRWFWD